MKTLRSGVLLSIMCLMLFSSQKALANIARLEILPGNIKMKPNTSIQLAVVAYTHDGIMFSPERNIRWRVQRGRIREGSYFAPATPGRYNISIEWRGLRANAKVHVKQVVPPIKYIQISPGNIELKPRQQYQFKAIAYDNYRRPVSIPLEWSANGGKFGHRGLYYSPDRYGKYVVTVREPYSGVRAQAHVLIRRPAPQITRIQIFPADSVVKPGQSVKFVAKAYDSYNREMPIQANWRANGGRIDRHGVFYAGHQPGRYQIWASYRNYKASGWVLVKGYKKPHPTPGAGRIDILNFKPREGNAFEPKIKITIKVFGRSAQKVTLFLVLPNGRAKEVQTKYCGHRSEVKFRQRYNSLAGYRWADVWLYDNYGKVIAKERRALRR